MSDKLIAIIDKPKNCQNCVWGICKYSTPLSTNRKGYYCQLKEPKDRTIDDFAYEDELHLSDCPLISLEEHDKEIRSKAIEEALEKSAKAICIGCGYLNGHECTYGGANCGVSKPMLEAVIKALEQMKEVEE